MESGSSASAFVRLQQSKEQCSKLILHNQRTGRDRAMGSFGHNIPFPLVEDILLRLPVESLVRFSCVCKSWSSLFQSSTFISRHLSNSMKRLGSSHNLLLRLWLTPYNHQLFSLSSEKEGDFSLKHISITMPNVRNINLSYHLVSNPYNGIVCLYSDFVIARDVALCNPTTREVRILPPSDLTTKIKDGMVLGVGMGNDSKCNGCMVVVRMWISYVECRCKKFIIEEYALCSDSWRTIESANPWRAEFDTSCFVMHFKGVHYWWAKLRDSTTTVLALNVGGGDFRKVPLPNPIDISSTIGRYFGVLNDSISLVCRDSCADNANFDIWVMDGVGFVGSSWTKLRTIKHIPCIPLVFWKGKELLVKMFDMLKSYNVYTGEIHNVNIEVKGHGIADICETIFCIKSLLSVKRRN